MACSTRKVLCVIDLHSEVSKVESPGNCYYTFHLSTHATYALNILQSFCKDDLIKPKGTILVSCGCCNKYLNFSSFYNSTFLLFRFVSQDSDEGFIMAKAGCQCGCFPSRRQMGRNCLSFSVCQNSSAQPFISLKIWVPISFPHIA